MGSQQPLTNFRLNHVTRHNARSLSYSITWVHTAHHNSPFSITYAHSESDGRAGHINLHSASRYFYLNHVSPQNVSRLPFFCCLHRAQQFSSSITWAHTAHHDYHFFFVTHPLPILLLPTRGITILFFQTPEPTLRITIYFLSLPTQVITILLFQSREPTQGITIIIFFFAHQAHKDSPLSITWALTVHHDYNSFVTHTRHNDSPLSHTCIHLALHHPFLLLPLQGKAILHFQSSAHTAHHGYSCFVESRSPTQGITVLFFKAREPI